MVDERKDGEGDLVVLVGTGAGPAPPATEDGGGSLDKLPLSADAPGVHH